MGDAVKRVLAMGRDAATSLKTLEAELMPRVAALMSEDISPPLFEEKRRVLCAELIHVLRNRTTRREAKRVGRVWEMLHRVCAGWGDGIWDVGERVLYGLIRAVKDGLMCLMECPSAKASMQNAIAEVLEMLGVEHGAVLFNLGRGFGDGMEILKSCVMHPDVQERVGSAVARILLHLIGKKPNVTGVFHLVRTMLLETFMTHRSALVVKEDYESLLVAVLFHSSMLKQWKMYLSCNEMAILARKETIVAKEKAPSVHALMESFEAAVASVPSAAAVFPFFFRGFLTCMENSKASDKWHLLSAKRAGFLFAARLMDISLSVYERDSSVVLEAILGLFSEMDRQKLYEPTLDEGFLQLQFLQRLAGKIFVDDATEAIAHPQKKRRKLCHPSTSPHAAIKLQMCSVLLSIEHRSLNPCLNEALQLLGENHQIEEASTILVLFMRASSKSRKWTSFISSLLKTLPSTPAFARLLVTEEVLDAFREGMKNLPTLETEAFLEMVPNEIRRQNIDLWTAKATEVLRAIRRLVEELVASVRIPETSAIPVAQCLAELTPSFEVLKDAKDSSCFFTLLRMSRFVDEKLEICRNWNPLAEKIEGMRCMQIESLIEVELLPGEDEVKEEIVECLLRRLNWLFHQDLSCDFKAESANFKDMGTKTAHVLLELLAGMKSEAARKLREATLAASFVPITTFGTLGEVMRYLETMLDDFRVHKEFFIELFQSPTVLSSSQFRESWKMIFLSSLRKRMSACFSTSIRISASELVAEVKKSLEAKLRRHPESELEFTQAEVYELLDFLEFGLELPVFLFGAERLLLEGSVLWISAVSNDPRILKCVSLFSLETLLTQPQMADYLRSAFFWIQRLGKVICERSVKEHLSKAEAAMFAMLKQLVFSQWCCGSLPFFGSTSRKKSKKAAWKQKSLTARQLFSALSEDSNKGAVQDRCFAMACVAVFVRFCVWLCRKHSDQRLKCEKGQSSLLWHERMHRELKKRNIQPDYHEIPTFLRTVVLPHLQTMQGQHIAVDEPPWDGLWLGTMAGIVADISGVADQASLADLQSLITPMLSQIEHMVFEKPWTEVPVCLDRVGYLMATLCVWMEKDTTGGDVAIHLTQLLLQIFIRVIDITHPVPHPLKQSFTSVFPSIEVVCGHCQESIVYQQALLKAFVAVLSHAPDESLLLKLLESLELSEPLASKFGSLQFLIVGMHHFKSSSSSGESKLPGKILERVYACFWEGYFRHVLLTFVQRKKRKSIHMPTDCEYGVFSATLCGFFRVMALCQSCAAAIPQRITIQVMRRIKRIVQALYRRSSHAEPSLAVPWFGEICGFVISAVHQQKSVEAARTLFPSFRAALESLLSLLIVWKVASKNATDLILEKAEIQLGAVYSETAAAPMFADGLPDLLLSYMRMIASLRTKKFTKQNPLSTYFKTSAPPASISEIELIPRVHQCALTVYSTIRTTQLRDMEAQLTSQDDLLSQMACFSRENAHFKGHAG